MNRSNIPIFIKAILLLKDKSKNLSEAYYISSNIDTLFH